MNDYSDTHWTKYVSIGETQYQPETRVVPLMMIKDTIDCIESGLDHTRSTLIDHDAALGRSTRKNESWAKQLEADIKLMEKTLDVLRKIY